ncbi:MAG: alanine racemase [Bacteroidales bacterium]|nr:alanine racemase [Bacteroidales bacterium]
MTLSVNEIAKAVSALKVTGNSNLFAEQMILKAATSAVLPNSIYFDLKRFKDPENAISRMYNLGVRIFVVTKSFNDFNNLDNATFIFVDNINKAINQYINYVVNNFKGTIISTPNRNGKCCVKDWMTKLLSINNKVFATTKYINELDFLENVSNINNSYDYAICEIPDNYNFTSIATIEQLDHVDYNEEEFSLDFRFNENNGIINLTQANVKNKYSIQIPFCDTIHAEDAARCLCYLVKQNIYNKEIHNSIFEKLEIPDPLIKMRQADFNIGIVSCFSTKNNIYSICKCFDFMARQHQFNSLTAVITKPDFETLSEDEFFNKLFFCANGCGISKIVFIGYYKQIPHNDNIKITKYDTIQDYIDNFDEKNNINGGILLKGVEYSDFADAFDFFHTGNHDTVLEVNLNALKHNLNYYRALLKPETKMIAMVKANCYGSGNFQIANMLENNSVDYLCVAFAEEGITLRRANIKMPIMVMNYDGRNYKQLINYYLEPVLFSCSRTLKLIEILKERHIKNYPVHIKLDTGMHRSGFMTHELEEFCNIVNQNKDTIKIVSMFTHFVAADDNQEDEFSLTQVNRFTEMANTICQKTGLNPMRHICNSVGIERFTDYQFNMVRLGIGLYGVAYEVTDKLMGISKWKTNIVQIKNIPMTETVGYNRRGKITRNSRIALIPVGYADGLNRKFGNRNLEVEINGKRAQIIGNICMDMCMVDITDIECKAGDEVVIFDTNNKLIEMANSISTIPYEILTGISPRVARVYVE